TAGAQDVPGLVFTAQNSEMFMSLLKQALKENGLPASKSRLDYAKENSWDMRAKEVSGLIFEALNKKHKKETNKKETNKKDEDITCSSLY
ncbi:MAG: hypothetical protein ABII23_08700, partial [bacterium]